MNMKAPGFFSQRLVTMYSTKTHGAAFQKTVILIYYYSSVQGRTQGRGLPGYSPPLPNPRKPKFKKKTDFVDIMISKVLRDFPFSRNQPLKLADD
jgi:hypothetical protein